MADDRPFRDRIRPGYPAAMPTGRLPDVPHGPAPGSTPTPGVVLKHPKGPIFGDGLTAAERASLDQRERDLAASIRLRCIEVAERIDPIRRALNTDVDTDATDHVIALARRLEAYVLGQDGATT